MAAMAAAPAPEHPKAPSSAAARAKPGPAPKQLLGLDKSQTYAQARVTADQNTLRMDHFLVRPEAKRQRSSSRLSDSLQTVL